MNAKPVALLLALGVLVLSCQNPIDPDKDPLSSGKTVSLRKTSTVGTVTVSGGFQSGHFDDVWDLTAGDMTISFMYNATGMVDDFGGAVAHAWSELGVRSLTTTPDFNPYYRQSYIEVNKKLFSGRDQVEVGKVKVWVDGNTLYVKYIITADCWKMMETHLAVAESEGEIPQTKTGNPIPGQFPYKARFDPAITQYTYAIDITSFYGKTLIIAAHAAIMCQTDGGKTITETAWAAKNEFPGANWATWFRYGLDPTLIEGSGIWLATDYDWTANTFDPDPAGAPNLDMDDKMITQRKGGFDEGKYNLPSSPTAYGNNYGFWFDRDGVDQWQALMWGCIDGKTYNTVGLYKVVMTLHATGATTGTAYMTVNGIPQGFYNGPWYNGQPALYPAGQAFVGDMKHLVVFYGIYGYGATHSATFSDITVSQ